MPAPAPPGSMELGAMTSSGFGAPTGGMVAGTASAGGVAAAGGGMSMTTIVVVSVLVLGGGTAGYFIYDYLTEPDFFGEVYWSDGGFGYMFEEDSISIVMAQYEGSCWMYEDFEGEEYTLTEKDDLCFLEMEFEVTVTDEGDYYDVCIDDDGDEDCIKVYPRSNAIVMDIDGLCQILISNIDPPNEFDGEEMNTWMDEFDDKRDLVDTPYGCQFSEDYFGSSGGSLDTYQFSDRDAAGQMSNASGDDLVHIQMTQGDDLSWAILKVSIVVDGGVSLSCQEASRADANADCIYKTDDDRYWSVSEEITIAEGAYDLCDGSYGGCDIDVTLTKIGVGNEDDKVIRTVSAYADAYN